MENAAGSSEGYQRGIVDGRNWAGPAVEEFLFEACVTLNRCTDTIAGDEGETLPLPTDADFVRLLCEPSPWPLALIFAYLIDDLRATQPAYLSEAVAQCGQRLPFGPG